jgi:hypothetical protein
VAQLGGKIIAMEHHVYFWLKEERKNAADRDLFEKGLADLYRIKEVAGGIWGQSAETPERPVTDKSFDYALSMRFETMDDHNVYQEDPDHDVFLDAFKDWWEKVLVMDVG